MRVRNFPMPGSLPSKVFGPRVAFARQQFVRIYRSSRASAATLGRRESNLSLRRMQLSPSARALLGMAPVVCLGVRSKLGRGGVQELRTHGARNQNDQLGFG